LVSREKIMVYEDPIAKAIMRDMAVYRALLAKAVPNINTLLSRLEGLGIELPAADKANIANMYAQVVEYRQYLADLVNGQSEEVVRLATELDRTLERIITEARRLVEYRPPSGR
jgi:hypothetical protein